MKKGSHEHFKTEISSVRGDKHAVIVNLQSRNKRMKTELSRIQEFMKQKNKMNNSDLDILKEEKRREVEKRELENAYQKIFFMEKQINRKQEQSKNVKATKRIQQVYTTLKQQQNMQIKLKKEIHDLNKIVSKKDKDIKSIDKESISHQVKNLVSQIDYLQERVKEFESSKSAHEASMLKQKKYLIKIQRELVEMGVSQNYLLQIRQKAAGIKAKTKETEQNSEEKGNRSYRQEIEEDIRTKKKYDKMRSEIRLLMKVQEDEEKLIKLQEIEYRNACGKNKQTLKMVKQVDNQIRQKQQQIKYLRSNLTVNDLKPKKYMLNLSSQSKEKVKKIGEKRKKKVKVNKGNEQEGVVNKIQQYNMLINPNLKYDEAGVSSSKGTKFSDRKVLGHSDTLTFMTGLHVYVNRNQNIISGIRVIYKKIEGQLHIVDEEMIHEECVDRFKCIEGEYIKSISGSLNINNQLQSLTVLTTNSRFCRFGRPHKTSHNFVFEIDEDEYPVCLFGSLNVSEQNGEIRYIESIGVQIVKQESYYGLDKSGRSMISNQFVQ